MVLQKQRISRSQRTSLGSAIQLLAASWVLLTLVGCGKSPEPAPTVTAPPTSAVVDDPASQAEPPGTIEMPSGVVPGASDAPAPSPTGGLELPKDVPLPTDSSSTPPVTTSQSPILFADWNTIEQMVTSSNQITIVDLWSLSCPPCMKEFPGLVRLHEQYGSKVKCIGVDVDFDGRKTRPPQSYQSRVDEFLSSVDAKFPNYISSTPSDDVFKLVDIPSIPAVLVYDAEGNLVKKFADAGDTIGFTYEKDVIPLVEKLAG